MQYLVQAKSGRRVGAIGTMHAIGVIVEAETPEAAKLRAYDHIEHLTGVTVELLESSYLNPQTVLVNHAQPGTCIPITHGEAKMFFISKAIDGNGWRLCNDSKWRYFAHLGTTSFCVRFYRHRGHAERRAKKVGGTVVYLEPTAELDAVGQITPEPKRPFDAVAAIIAYESGEAGEDQIVELFQHLIDSGKVNHLQGSYGRQAAALIQAGLCSPPGS